MKKNIIGAVAVCVALSLVDDASPTLASPTAVHPTIIYRTRATNSSPTPIACFGPGGPVIHGPGGIKYAYMFCLERASHLFRDLLFTERDKGHHLWNGHTIDWKNWNTYMPGLVDRCASKAKVNGCKNFAVSYYGECWAARRKIDRIQVFTSHMMNRNKCVKEWYQTCGVHSKRCVGKDHGFAVYELDPYTKRK